MGEGSGICQPAGKSAATSSGTLSKSSSMRLILPDLMQWPLRHICGTVDYLLAYLPHRELEMSDPGRPTPSKRPRRAAQDRAALGARSDPQLRLRVTRRAEPDVRRLVEW